MFYSPPYQDLAVAGLDSSRFSIHLGNGNGVVVDSWTRSVQL